MDMTRFSLLLSLILTNYIHSSCGDHASDQLIEYLNKTNGLHVVTLTTGNGAPVSAYDASSAHNIIRNRYMIESLEHLVRERIPERVVHAKGAGAFGYFEVTKDQSAICKAKIFGPVGQITPVAVRFSPTFSHLGSADSSIGGRGFAVKFYTEEGNFDILGFSIPVFPINDPILFRSFVHSQSRNPATNSFDGNMLWDFVTSNPGSINSILRIFSNYGTPLGYQYMPGYSIHTYELVNEDGTHSFVRFHFQPEAGVQNLNASTATAIAGFNPDNYTRSLYNAIGDGNYPTWEVKLQILSLEDVMKANFNPFDTTRELSLTDYPLQEFGRLVLNRNPLNYFAEVEQMAFCPSNLVPGILGAPDKMFEARMFAYRDAQNYRLGKNFDNIGVNYAYRSKVATYNRDGIPPNRNNGMDAPNYYPNSFNGPVPTTDKAQSKIQSITQNNTLNFDQANDFYSNKLTTDEKRNLESIIVTGLSVTAEFLRNRTLSLLREINADLAQNIEEGLANMSAAEVSGGSTYT